MAAEIRVDTIKSRSGINTFFLGGDALTFNQNVGIGTTISGDPVTSANTGKVAVGIVSTRNEYVGLITANRGAGYSYVNVGTGVSVVGISTFLNQVDVVGVATFFNQVNVGTAATFNQNGNATISGITTFGGTSHVRIPSGTDAQRPGTGVAGDFRYNTTSGSFEGYTSEWGSIGGGGGVSQVSGIVSTTSTVGFAASFAHATYRSASVNFLINDATGASQAGKYIMIHDGTTVTVVEQVAVATGSMLGTLSGAIVGTNAELQITMNSAGVATCSAKIDTMADAA